MQRLHPERLALLPAQVQRPGYDRSAHGAGIVHLGIGAFHRAHQAVYLDDVMARSGGDWRVLGVSCRGGTVRDQLQPQQGLYTLMERSDGVERLRIIGALAEVLVAPKNPQAVIAALAQPTTQLITLTITEKGYYRDPASGRLDLRHADIVHDLNQPPSLQAAPRTPLGLLTESLRQRWQQGHAAPTLLCCDNLPHNGATLKQVLLEFIDQRDAALAKWVASEVPCPSTMVDRIVPATTPDDIAALAKVIGLRDEGMVKTEPFSQWVIEDNFAGARPPFETVGALLVSDVRPFEIAKLRLLNGSHSTLAYLGHQAGYRFVHEAVTDSELRSLVQHLMQQELAPTLDPVPGLDVDAYQVALLGRFANSTLSHRLLQIAMDGSQKLPQRLLTPLALRLQRGQSINGIALAIAAWMRHITGRGEHGTHVVDDPLAARLATAVTGHADNAADLANALLGVSEVFGHELPQSSIFRSAVTRQLEMLLTRGVGTAIHEQVQRFTATYNA